jgi:signal transduction histidine kinase
VYPAHELPPPQHTARALLRYTSAGIVAALLVLLAGRMYERVRLGAADAAALATIAAEVRDVVDRIAAELRAAAEQAAVDPALLTRASSDPEVARRLFDVARAALPHTGERSALTLYAATGAPLAWSGRPSDLPPDRLQGPRALFVAPGPMGPRLVFVDPRMDAGQPARRAGLTAVEQVLGPDAPSGRGDVAELPTGLVPVALRAPYEGAGEAATPYGFLVSGPDGRPLLEAEVAPAALRALRARVRGATVDAMLAVLAFTALVLIVPLADARERTRSRSAFAAHTLSMALLIVGARAILAAAVPESWTWSSPASELAGWRALLFRSPADLLFTALAAGGLVVVAGTTIERRRVASRLRAATVMGARAGIAFAAAHLAVGIGLAALIGAYYDLLGAIMAASTLSPLQFSLHPLDRERLVFVIALLVLHAAAFWAAVVLLRLASTWWRVGRGQSGLRLLMALCWALPVAGLSLRWLADQSITSVWPLVSVGLAAAATTSVLRWANPRYRHASQALRLIVLFAALALPSIIFYPSMVMLAEAGVERTVLSQLAPQALAHRSELQVQLRRSLAQIDRVPDLHELASGAPPSASEAPPTDRAFLLWRQTDLARLRLTSSIELYGPGGQLTSRFALNLPAEAAATQQWTETSCRWDVFGEPLAGTEDRVLLHAGRGICPEPGGTPLGAIVVHVMLDYATLPFLAGAGAYGDLFQAGMSPADAHGRGIEFAMYGWGRTPIFSTEGLAWPITSDLLERIYSGGRRPLWQDITRGDSRFRVLFVNDRSGIYAIGYPAPRSVEHLIAVAEIVTLAGVAYLGLLALASAIANAGGHRAATGRALLREIRRSFYRKLFLAFVAAALVPVLALALLTRTYVASELRDGIESAAARTASVARRVVENVASEQRRDSTAFPVLSDEMMVWVSRVIDEDVNVYAGPRLVATSQRDLFASGRLPTRTPAEVFRAIVLERQAGYVGAERIGEAPAYMLAATPIRDGDARTVLTVPLALRQQEIEREIDNLDRRMLLATVLFILIAAGLGYSMAERIADPVNRLTRATGRIARGDLDARIVTSSADEFRRLVDAFNGMAADLQRQRAELERTNRLAAWADMARQVAHDIKNPLTPIQLSAEHLRRVHDDRQRPLSPVLESCVDTILSQVRLLRQISSEFSSFASAPVATLVPTSLNGVVEETLQPYRTTPGHGVDLHVELAPDLPSLPLDRLLLGRALVNIVENALHAMPGGGTLTVRTEAGPPGVRIVVSDTGVGMDENARQRLFEPYFSTRAAGTGLGLTIAKRNVELNRGTIDVESTPGRGTTVRLLFPIEGHDIP